MGSGTTKVACRFLSTLSSRRATGLARGRDGPRQISIHALLAESDFAPVQKEDAAAAISIHALLAESDLRQHVDQAIDQISIHALLAESDDLQTRGSPFSRGYFYPRSPRGERLVQILMSKSTKGFLSTLSSRRATGNHHDIL